MATMEKPKPKIKKRSKHKFEDSEHSNASVEIKNFVVIKEGTQSNLEDRIDVEMARREIVEQIDNLALESAQDENISSHVLPGSSVELTGHGEERSSERGSEVEGHLVEITTDDNSRTREEITRAIEDCRSLSEVVGSIAQPLPLTETSSVVSQEVSTLNVAERTNSITYKELAANVSTTIRNDLKTLSAIKAPKVQISPFTMEEIQNIFGVQELEKAAKYASEFENNEMQHPSLTHPLYDALIEFQNARTLQIHNQRDVASLMSETMDKINSVWHIENCVERVGGRCADGCYLEETHAYQVATLQRLFLLEMHKKLGLLREKATDVHSQHSHLEYYLKYKIDDLLWTSSVNGVESIRSSLRILFWVLRTSGWGYDRALRMQLRKWCCCLGTKLLETEYSLENLLFLMHHVLRVSRGIKWFFHLINCNVKCWADISKVLCLLEAIVCAGDLPAPRESDLPRQRNISEGVANDFDVVVAADAMDDNVWFVVDSDGEGADLEAEGRGRGLLSETDVLGLLRQIPFEDVFKELMVVRNDGAELVFCGGNLNGGPVIKILSSLRMILKTIDAGLITYKKYPEASKELCRIALHCFKYFTDLWEVAKTNCEPHLLERVLAEYNNLFLVTWNTIESSGSKDSISMFQAEMPCHLVHLETVQKAYKSIADNLKVSDNIGCYYSLVCISNMAVCRTEEEFLIKAVKKLFEIGFASDFSELGCGEWARTLCGTALQSKPHLIGPLLAEAPVPQQAHWLESLPLSEWRPQTGEVVYLLNHFKQHSPSVIPQLLKGMNWSRNCLQYETHKAVALFLVLMSRGIEQPKGQYPECIWECLLPLRLHMYDWDFDINSVPEPETITELDISGKCHASSIVTIVLTTWGHSVPLIFQNAAPLLLKLANAGRFGEVIHALYYLIPVLSECPESISDCKIFKELLSVIIRHEKTYTKMAARFVVGETVGPVTKQLVVMIQSQLRHFSLFKQLSPRNLLMVWIYWLTCSDNWQADWVVIYLMDVALGSCFLHHDAVSAAANHLAEFIHNAMAKSPMASSSGFSWLWNSNSYKGLVQCNVEAPYVWHATLWTEHSIMERCTGLWQKLVTKLAARKEGTKINIDKTLKSVGCSDSSSILVIYRCAQYGTSMSVSHPIFTLIWQLFFCLYLDVSFIQFQDKKPVGSLFFEGMVNSRLLTKAKMKLLEAKTYHENKVLEFASTSHAAEGVQNEKQWYHESQKNLMTAFHSWLREDINQYLGQSTQSQALPFYDKFSMLLSGNNTLWMDTVDYFQLNSFQPAQWPQPLVQMITYRLNPVRRSETSLQSQPAAKSRGRSPDTDPSSRIIHRLKSYEQPLIESKEYQGFRLSPLVDPSVGNNFDVISNMMRYNLNQVEECARAYNETCKSLNSTDHNLHDLIQGLYERRHINRSVLLGCGEACQGKVQLNIQVADWRRITDVGRSIDYNRSMYRLAIDDALSPYEQMAAHTAVVYKLATMACEGKIVNAQENGPKMFNIVIDHINENIVSFATAHHIIICFATLLGEKFVTQSGEHFINLVCKVRGPESAGLVGALLRPCQLSTVDMIKVYSAISSTVTDYHVAFSYLTKFNISKWLHNVRPNASDRSKFLTLLFTSLGTAGCEPCNERLILHELMCVHLTKVMAWEFPVHLPQVLTALCNLSLEKKIPPDTWQHCITIIETYPNTISNKLGCECLELVGKIWWSKRGTWGTYGLYGQYGLYCTQMGRLGAILSSTVLSTAMLYNPPLLTKEICGIVTRAMQSFWSVWLCPWWAGRNQTSTWVGELRQGPVLMPWGPNDDEHPDTMLDAFVETILYCATTLPGSLNDLLSLIWQWYGNNFPHHNVNPHVLVRIHRALCKLPWTVNAVHWLTWPDLRLLFKIIGLNIDLCNQFSLKCLGDRPWVCWLEMNSEFGPSVAVQYLLPLILKLNPSKEVLDDAEYLPWGQMSVEAYEENVSWFKASMSTSAEPLYAHRMLPLLCAAGGLTGRAQYGEVWRNKRNILIKTLVNIISSLDESPASVEAVQFLLNRIQVTVDSLENSSDSQKFLEASSMLSSAIPMFVIMKTTNLIEQVWCNWFRTTSVFCISAVVSNIVQVTKRDAFSKVAEEALTKFFELEGDWSFVLSNWRNECIVAVDFLLNNKSLLAAMATYKVSDRGTTNSTTIHPIDKAALQALYALEVECAQEKSASLWICYIMDVVADNSLDRANTFAVINQAVSVLTRLGQEPSWGLFKAMGLLQNNTPSNRFRLLARFALCCTLDYQRKVKDPSLQVMNMDNLLHSKTMSSIESMINHKSCADIKHIIVKYLEVLKEPDRTIKASLKHVVEMCYDLYSDMNYIKNINALFESVL